MVKKYLIRVAGALCILGSLALMFLTNWIELDGVERRDLKNIRSDVDGMCSAASDRFTMMIERDEDFKDELKDYDLPNTRGKIKSRFNEIGDLVNSLLDGDISLKELLTLSLKAPGVVTDMGNLMESECSSTFFMAISNYIVYEGSGELNPEEYDIGSVAAEFEDIAYEAMDGVSDVSFAFYLLAGVLFLVIALAVASAATHICNKGRWVKYLFLTVLVILVAGTCVALFLMPDVLAEALAEMPELEDMELKITVMPFLAIVLMAAPIVLDIIFERKNKNIYMEA